MNIRVVDGCQRSRLVLDGIELLKVVWIAFIQASAEYFGLFLIIYGGKALMNQEVMHLVQSAHVLNCSCSHCIYMAVPV